MSLFPDPVSCLGDVLKVIKSVYSDRRHLEKSLKSAVGITHDRVSSQYNGTQY